MYKSEIIPQENKFIRRLRVVHLAERDSGEELVKNLDESKNLIEQYARLSEWIEKDDFSPLERLLAYLEFSINGYIKEIWNKKNFHTGIQWDVGVAMAVKAKPGKELTQRILEYNGTAFIQSFFGRVAEGVEIEGDLLSWNNDFNCFGLYQTSPIKYASEKWVALKFQESEPEFEITDIKDK